MRTRLPLGTRLLLATIALLFVFPSFAGAGATGASVRVEVERAPGAPVAYVVEACAPQAARLELVRAPANGPEASRAIAEPLSSTGDPACPYGATFRGFAPQEPGACVRVDARVTASEGRSLARALSEVCGGS